MRELNLRMFDDFGDGNAALIRNAIADYMEVNGQYVLLGVGFNTINESPGAKSESTVYVNQKGSFYSIDSYDTKFAFDMHLIPANPAIMDIYNIGRNHATGDACVRNFLRVELFNAVGTPSDEVAEYTARKFSVAVEVTSYEANGGEKFSAKGNFNGRGDPVFGKFDTVAMKFTEGDFKGKFDPTPSAVAAG